MLKKSLAAAAVLAAILFLPSPVVPQHLGADALQPLASLSASGAGVEWLPRIADYGRLILTVAGPSGLVIRREFEQGKSPAVDLVDESGQSWPDGSYSYELRLVPRVEERLRQEIRRAREAGDEARVEALLDSAGLHRDSPVQAGSLMVRDGRLLVPEAPQEPTVKVGNASHETADAAEKTVVTPPLIVPGGACIGDECSASDEPFSLTLKNSQPSILFDTIGSISNRDWFLWANAFPSLLDRFVLHDEQASTNPFVVEGNAPTASLYVRDNGNLGLGTTFPLKDVHAVNTSSPTIRLEQTTGALPARTWDLVANDVGFSIQDVTTASPTVPVRVRAAAPTGSVEVNASGFVGLGTTSPTAKLHVAGNAGNSKVLVQESGPLGFRELLELSNNGDPFLIFANSANGSRWSNGTNAGTFQILDQADPQTEFSLASNGDLTISGVIIQNSSREAKENFTGVDRRGVLERVLAMPITTWSYKEAPGVRHMGPVAEDFFSAFHLGADDKGITTIDTAGVAFAAIQGLYARMTEKEAKLEQVARENAELAQRNRELEERLARVEGMLQILGVQPRAAMLREP